MKRVLIAAGVAAAASLGSLAAMAAGQPTGQMVQETRVRHMMKLPATRAEALAQVRAHFVELDRNGDGAITRDEVPEMPAPPPPPPPPSGRAGMPDEPPAPPPPPPGLEHGGMMAMMFDRIDADHDGRVTRAEAEQSALARFDRVDTDHDGKISDAERAAVRPEIMIRRMRAPAGGGPLPK